MTPKTIEGEGRAFDPQRFSDDVHLDRMTEFDRRKRRGESVDHATFLRLARTDIARWAYEQGKKDALRASESAPDISPD